MSELPTDRKYTKEHEWALVSGSEGPGVREVTIGITTFAVEQLGDITLVNFDVKAGDSIEMGKAFGTIESVKTLSDLFAPVGGRILKVNPDLAMKPELVNEDCYGKAWMIVVAATDGTAIDALMDAKAYGEYLKTAAH
jgi:glycine cleavage system H protein